MDTIVALATFPSATSALNVIRISGKESKRIISVLFVSSKNLLKHRTVYYGDIINPLDKKKVDDVILLPFYAPHSFTGEDLFEIICHGGNIIYRQIISLLIDNGARFAESGEFTKRAYLNNKIDLSQAEAINDIILSENDVALELARKNLDGVLGREVNELRETLIDFLSKIETSINFPEDETIALSPNSLDPLLQTFASLLDSAAFHDDINIEDVVILGEPNVGKSSLMNRLAGEDKSIVTDISGTTRDLIEHHVNLSGIKINLIDTAGINNATSDAVEGIGIQKALGKLKTAHIALYMIDGSLPLNIEGIKSFFEEYLNDSSLRVIFLINKIDLTDSVDLSFLSGHKHVFSISIKENLNIDKVQKSLLSLIDEYSEEVLGKSFFLNVRQRELLLMSMNSIQEAKVLHQQGETDEIIADFIRSALLALEKIIGKVSDEDLLDSIFTNFCIGK